ncbi:MAG: hypothetical protein GY797_21505, partial [Deltaproteobacteria bacterium]|nr:hypothetical protein [Deltaproteobacteria bacterium]
EIIAVRFAYLSGQPITLTKAAKKYNVPRSTLQNWVYRSNYLKPIPPASYPANFDEAEIAYLADIYQDRQRTGSRAPLIDESGLPYELKHPDLAQYRRKKKKTDSP